MLDYSEAFCSFSVNDAEAAKSFYGGILGLNIEEIPGMQGMLRLRCAGGTTAMIYSKTDHAPATFTVLNFPVGDLERVVDKLTAQGVRFERYDQEDIKTDGKGIARGKGGPEIAWFKDPAGNILSVLEMKQSDMETEIVGAGEEVHS